MKYVYEVLGPRIKVKILSQEEEVSKQGIILSTDIKDKSDLEVGEVMELGHMAYLEDDEPWVKKGDVVLFQRYTGKPEREGKDFVRLLNDKDVIAIRHKVEEE